MWYLCEDMPYVDARCTHTHNVNIYYKLPTSNDLGLKWKTIKNTKKKHTKINSVFSFSIFVSYIEVNQQRELEACCQLCLAFSSSLSKQFSTWLCVCFPSQAFGFFGFFGFSIRDALEGVRAHNRRLSHSIASREIVWNRFEKLIVLFCRFGSPSIRIHFQNSILETDFRRHSKRSPHLPARRTFNSFRKCLILTEIRLQQIQPLCVRETRAFSVHDLS